MIKDEINDVEYFARRIGWISVSKELIAEKICNIGHPSTPYIFCPKLK
jgi:hypothetical protein